MIILRTSSRPSEDRPSMMERQFTVVAHALVHHVARFRPPNRPPAQPMVKKHFLNQNWPWNFPRTPHRECCIPI